MKNKVILLTVPFILMLLLSAFVPKPKNDKVGGIAGRMILEYTNSWKPNPQSTFQAGRYYDITIVLEDKKTNNRIRVKADKYGYFSILNLSPGLYEISECNLEDYYQFDIVWNMQHPFKYAYDQNNKTLYDEKIKRKYGFIMVYEKQITVLNTLIIVKTFVKNDGDKAYSTSKYEIDYDYESVINNFKEKDKKNNWADFILFKHDEEKTQ